MKEFMNETVGAYIIIENRAYNKLIQIAKEGVLEETGGVLIGYYNSSRKKAIITDISSAPADSKSGQTWFVRGILGLNQMLAIKWQEGEYYLGEWHIHPKSSPTPSLTDIRQMKSIAKDNKYHCREPILLIVGENLEEINMHITLIVDNKLYVMNEIIR